MRHALRGAPVALLASLLVVAVAARVKHRRVPTPPAQPGVVTLLPPAPHTSIAAVPVGGTLAPVPPVRMQHGDRRRTGRSSMRGPPQLRVRWKTPNLGAIEAEVVTSPDEATLYAASLGGELIALAGADGAIRFRIPLGGRSYSTPCVDAKGNVYVSSDNKKLFAVAPEGRVAWTLDLDDEGDTACALADDGMIVFAAGRNLEAVTPGGDVSWRFAARKKIFTAPAIDDRHRVFVGSQDHRVYAVESGRKAWSVDLGADVDGSPAIDDDGTIVVGTDGGEIVKLDTDGGVLWSAHVGGFVRGALSIARGGDVMSGVYGPHSRVVRLDGKSGVEKASFDVPGTGSLEFGVHGGPLEDREGKLYFGAQDDRIYIVDPHGTTSSMATGGDVDAAPTLLANGALVIASDDGAVYCLEP